MMTATNGLWFFLATGWVWSACGTTSLSHRLKPLLASDQQVAVWTFEENRLPIAPGSDSVMVGYIPVRDGPSAASDPRDARFTYLIALHVTSSKGMGEQIEGRGIRKVFFNPRGAHASFGDLASFSRGRHIETDIVKIYGEYVREDTHLRLKVRVCDSVATPIEFGGRPVVMPSDEPWIFQGRWRESIGGWMLSSSPISF